MVLQKLCYLHFFESLRQWKVNGTRIIVKKDSTASRLTSSLSHAVFGKHGFFFDGLKPIKIHLRDDKYRSKYTSQKYISCAAMWKKLLKTISQTFPHTFLPFTSKQDHPIPKHSSRKILVIQCKIYTKFKSSDSKQITQGYDHVQWTFEVDSTIDPPSINLKNRSWNR